MLKHESTQSKRRLHAADEETNNKRVKQPEITVTIQDKVGEPIPFHIDHATSNGGEVIIERDATQYKHYLIVDKKTGRVYLPHLGHRIIVDAMFMTTTELVLISYSAEASNAIDDLLVNRKSVTATLKKYPGVYDNSEVALVAMTLKGTPPQSLKLFSEPLQRKKTLVLAAVGSNSDVLAHVSKELRDDEQVVMLALNSDTHDWENYDPVLKYASPRLRALKHVVMAAVNHEGSALADASEDMRADKEVVMTAVKQDGDALRHASDDLRADKEVVMAAVHQYGMALKYASNTLRAHKDVVATAIANMPRALQHASEDLCMTIS